ncbi:MAG: DEAD/DEAH box helicase family protein [Bacteroidetes bacterium]|nr:DEAD/DEAH box helicase family protein [Bacteroidota bacterium]
MIEKFTDIKSILNLRSNDSIGEELANRQLEAITKSYQYLSKTGNNIIYIADEVGLGKTYIAAGIAMLFRHFSADTNSHKDLIIVPKKNLQDKWKKELKNFVSNNYLCDDALIKQQYNFDEAIKDRLMPIRFADPISIFRMTSFSSIAATQDQKSKSKLYFYLLSNIFNNDEFAKSIINDAWQLGYFKKGLESNLRKLVAYLMNALSPRINCLIIDEAHNYKYGIGGDNYDESIRNETTARFLGAVKDNSILNNFPELRSKIKLPLAEKIICLSATPKDRSLLEIKNQFNCFSNKHILSDSTTAGDIESRLKRFLLRGNLEYVLNTEVVSRNQCREEHRKGNVNKSEVSIPLAIDDSFDAVFWQLLQYKSIKHLDQKNNASFEIGMLASFETYMADLDRRSIKNIQVSNELVEKEDKEYEQTAHRDKRVSQDINIIRGITQSYYETFKERPPHPKQTKLADEIIEQLKRQEKSLIFVRRVKSSEELAKSIMERFENEIVLGQYLKFTGKFTKFKTQELNTLISSFNNHYSEMIVAERLDDTLRLLLEKDEIKNILLAYVEINDFNYEVEGLIWLRIAFDSDKASAFKASISDYIKRSLVNISQTLKDVTISAINETYKEYKRHSEKDEEIDSKSEDTQSGYFFLDYFKKGRKGFYYRQKMYRENWFEINPVILNNHFKCIEYPSQGLNTLLSNIKIDPKKKKNQSFKLATETTLEYFQEKGSLNTSPESVNLNIPPPLNETTFITRLLCEFCDAEIRNWLEKRIKSGSHILYLRDLKVLNALLRNILRNGSGLLPGFLADSTGLDFNDELLYLIAGDGSPFAFVLQEIKTIINDFDLIVAVNFQERDENKINSILRNLTPIVGTSGQDDRDRGILAAQFRMPGFPYVLITTDIFREGEDLHTYCQNVYHYGIAWNPSDMEQRTGRIDRINSKSYRMLNNTKELSFENKVQVFYPYLRHSVEVNQVVQLLRNLNKFVETFNDIVIDIKYESAVSVNDEIIDENIPAPITKRLKSKYDIHDFEVD